LFLKLQSVSEDPVNQPARRILAQSRISEGLGSFSELIRVAVQEWIASRHGCSAEALRAAMERLNARMEEVGRDVKQLKTSPAEAIR
jgi:hypothetical protein